MIFHSTQQNSNEINNGSTTDQQKSTLKQPKTNIANNYYQQNKQHIPTLNSNIKTTLEDKKQPKKH